MIFCLPTGVELVLLSLATVVVVSANALSLADVRWIDPATNTTSSDASVALSQNAAPIQRLDNGIQASSISNRPLPSSASSLHDNPLRFNLPTTNVTSLLRHQSAQNRFLLLTARRASIEERGVNMTSPWRHRVLRQAGKSKGKEAVVAAESKSPARLACYACTFLHEPAHSLGQAGCDDPFQHLNINEVFCTGHCGKIYRKLDTKGSFQLTRLCASNCKEMDDPERGYTKCCSSKLCNGAPSRSKSAASVLVLAVTSLVLARRIAWA